MKREDDRDREIRTLKERLAKLTEASVRISESLDFDTVLKGVLDSARALTGARYGVITLLDPSGQHLDDFLYAGMTPEQSRLFAEIPDGFTFFYYLNSIEGPLRVRDFKEYLRAHGLPEIRFPFPVSPVLHFLGAPIHHLGERIGAIYVAEKEQEFTAEDEETLVMFASQAAMVIANARRHRDEQRARADLEALIDTSPVGVAVFDARTGAPVSFNREAVRILEDLRTPDNPPEHLLQVLTVRRADGREVSLEGLSMVEALIPMETVRAEEMVFSVPDGRSVTVLVNATPIHAQDGDFESCVVTLQDMTPLQEQERLRAEFLATVSHELRTPLAAVKGSVTTLIDPPAPLSPAEMKQFHRIIDSQINRMHVLISDLLDVARIETGSLAIAPEPTDVAVLVREARNAFRSLGDSHIVEMDIPQDLPWIMADQMRMLQLLGNLFNNAARHSSLSSPIRVSAGRDGVHVAVSVSDQGRGIPAESLPLLFQKFSRIESEEQRGDTGLGLAICKGIAEAHGGRIWAESDGPGLGASFTFTIPAVEESGYVSPVAPVRTSVLASRRRAEQVRILALDDDPQALRYVNDALINSGYAPIVTPDPEDALRLVEEEKPHLVLLDLMLPGVDGIDLMTEIRSVADVPVIFVSAYGQDQLVARAFNMGADDYVVKPFSPTELAARIGAALRRRSAPEPPAPYVLGDLVIDYAERLVTLAGVPVRLTAIEYRTLAELSANAGRVSTYDHLLRRIWGVEEGGELGPLRTVVNTLRRRLGDDAKDPAYIFTELRVGYRMPKGERGSLTGVCKNEL